MSRPLETLVLKQSTVIMQVGTAGPPTVITLDSYQLGFFETMKI